MSVDRGALLTYLAAAHAPLLAAARLDPSDSLPGLYSVLDRAFRAVGIPQASLLTASVPDETVAKLEAAADYFLYERAVQRLAVTAVDSTSGPASERVQRAASQIYRQANEQLAGPYATSGLFTINLDLYEPAGTE